MLSAGGQVGLSLPAWLQAAGCPDAGGTRISAILDKALEI